MKRSRRLIIPAVLSVVTIAPGVVISCGESPPTTPDAEVAHHDATDNRIDGGGLDSLPDVVIDTGNGADAGVDSGVIDAMPADTPA